MPLRQEGAPEAKENELREKESLARKTKKGNQNPSEAFSKMGSKKFPIKDLEEKK